MKGTKGSAFLLILRNLSYPHNHLKKLARALHSLPLSFVDWLSELHFTDTELLSNYAAHYILTLISSFVTFGNMDELRKAIGKGEWQKTDYVCYHEYIVQERQPEVFRLIAGAIENAEFFDFWRGSRYNNLYVDGWKYWRMGNIINRKPAEPPSK